MTARLDGTGLGLLPADVARPGYDLADHRPGIVHLGIGAFHRAHQAVYTDDAMARHGGDWRIVGVSLRSPVVRDQLHPQDGLYTLIERDGDGDRLRVVGAVADVLCARDQPEAVIAAIADPAIHIVSLTVTEKGYCHEPATGRLNRDHPEIARELAGGAPTTAVGFLAAGLARRRALGSGPLTLLSCDNLPHNGAVLAAVLRDFVADPALLAWIDAHVRCPSTMVDRIVPATTEADRATVRARLGLADHGTVKAEPFSQWVIEDDFAGPRPAWEDAGAQLVADVRPFELAKLRMLNGAHSTLAYLGLRAGHVTVDQAIADPAIAAVVDRLMRHEAAGTLPAVPGLDTDDYADALIARFANPALDHRLIQIAMDGSQKLPQRLLGTIADCHDRGIMANAALTGVAAWMLHVHDRGPALDDPMAPRLAAAAQDTGLADLVARLLDISEIFGPLGTAPWFRDAVHERTGAL